MADDFGGGNGGVADEKQARGVREAMRRIAAAELKLRRLQGEVLDVGQELSLAIAELRKLSK